MKFPKRGAYHGRLAYDPETGFHVDPKGRKVVTLDEGKTWLYARGHTSHFDRHNRRLLTVNTTANAETPEYHHDQPLPSDPHRNGVTFTPDLEAVTQTSHTDSWL